MRSYNADIHIHTVASPCADLSMSPVSIVEKAVEKGLNIIGITDHNCTKHCKLIKNLAGNRGIFVLMGAEITTKEEIHCLTFFEKEENLDEFQSFLEEHLTQIKNVPEKFGYQLVVDEQERIVEELPFLLISSIAQTVGQVEKKVHDLNGIFIPAHVDRKSYSIMSQLGFIPKNMKIDGIEVSAGYRNPERMKELSDFHGIQLLQNSDAHKINQIGSVKTQFLMERCTFTEIKLALSGAGNRKVLIR